MPNGKERSSDFQEPSKQPVVTALRATGHSWSEAGSMTQPGSVSCPPAGAPRPTGVGRGGDGGSETHQKCHSRTHSSRAGSPVSRPSWLLAHDGRPSVRDVLTWSKVVVEQIAIGDEGATGRSRFSAIVITRQASL